MSPLLAVYVLPLALIWGLYAARRRRHENASRAALDQARSAGLVDPASMHPVIDPVRCIGCGSCVKACPEQPEHRVLGLIDGKAQLDRARGLHRSRRLSCRVPGGRDHAGVRHGTARSRDPIAHARFRIDRTRPVRRGRARRDGADPQRAGAGTPGGRRHSTQGADEVTGPPRPGHRGRRSRRVLQPVSAPRRTSSSS